MSDDTVPPPPEDEPPRRDFERMFDLNRSSVIKGFVDEMEGRMRDIETAQGDLKAIVESAKEQEFNPNEIKAMKKIAKLRLKDQRGEASQELAALERVGKAVGFDVFDWSAVRS